MISLLSLLYMVLYQSSLPKAFNSTICWQLPTLIWTPGFLIHCYLVREPDHIPVFWLCMISRLHLLICCPELVICLYMFVQCIKIILGQVWDVPLLAGANVRVKSSWGTIDILTVLFVMCLPAITALLGCPLSWIWRMSWHNHLTTINTSPSSVYCHDFFGC